MIDQPVPLGQQADGVPQVGVQLPLLELLARLEVPRVGDGRRRGSASSSSSATLVVEGQHDRAVDALLEPVQLLRRGRHRLGHLVGRWAHGPRSVASCCAVCSSVRASVRTERGAQSAARTASRMAPRMRWAAKRWNGHPPGAVVAAGRLDQAEGAGPGQLLAVDVAGEVHRHLEHDVPHQRQVLLDRLRWSIGIAHRSDRPPRLS